MANEITICNMALAQLGEAPITSITNPQTRNEELCALYYDSLRRAILEEAQWSFAIRRVAIEGVVLPEPAWGYSQQHLVPEDTLRILFVGQQQNERKYSRFDWRLEDGVILSNAENIFIRYTADEQDPNKFSNNFIQCFQVRFAAEMCIAVTENRALRSDLYRLYEEKLQTAVTLDSMQGRSEKLLTGQLLNNRQSGIGWGS